MEAIPQIFCPYKEVLQLYQKGIALPDDVTIVWADDNHGYIRQLSTPKEQLRSGKSGVYYHLSYWGAPSDYLWLSSVPPMLISYEMNKAYQYGATRLWMFNVGDIKPAEIETEFSLDFAWNVKAWPPEKVHLYIKHWAARTFGPEYAEQIADIKHDYYQLAQTGKPEHLDMIAFTREEAEKRLAAYQKISDEAETLGRKIPDRLKDAYFQLILYPTVCAARMNEKFLYAAMSNSPKPGDNISPAAYAEKARFAYSEIQRLTKIYNNEIAGGKWNKMMDYRPRNRPVFNMPPLAESSGEKKAFKEDSPVAIIDAANYKNIAESGSAKLQLIEGLGASGSSLTIVDVTTASVSDANILQAPYVEYEVKLPAGQRTIEVLCVPTHRIHTGRGLRYAISLDNESPTIVNVHSDAETPEWSKNVVRGYSIGKSSHKLDKDGIVNIRIALLDPGLLISSDKNLLNHFDLSWFPRSLIHLVPTVSNNIWFPRSPWEPTSRRSPSLARTQLLTSKAHCQRPQKPLRLSSMTNSQWLDLLRVINGERLDPLPRGLIIDCPWLPGWAGISMIDYFGDDRLWLEANLKAVRQFENIMFLPGFWSEYGMCTEPSAFGAKCIYP